MNTLAILFSILVIAPSTAWMALAIYYHSSKPINGIVDALCIVGGISVGLWMLPFLPWAISLWLLEFALVLAWWFTLRPEMEADWLPGMAVMPGVNVEGNVITIQDYRNFQYDSNGTPTPRYEVKSFDLSKLQSLDYFLSNISGPLVVHTMVSFGFEGGEYLMVSVEARRKVGVSYSPLRGLFRQYGLMYVLGDERDLVRLRTNVRRERVNMYRLHLTTDHIRTILLDFLQRAESLRTKPRWYNSLTCNCTTNLFYNGRHKLDLPSKLGVFVNGLSARTLYRIGALGGDLPFREHRNRSDIGALALADDEESKFSETIRTRIVQLDDWTI